MRHFYTFQRNECLKFLVAPNNAHLYSYISRCFSEKFKNSGFRSDWIFAISFIVRKIIIIIFFSKFVTRRLQWRKVFLNNKTWLFVNNFFVIFLLTIYQITDFYFLLQTAETQGSILHKIWEWWRKALTGYMIVSFMTCQSDRVKKFRRVLPKSPCL